MLVNICEPHIQRFPSIIWTAEERDHNPENKQQINKETRMQFLSKIKINQISRSRHQIKLSTREIALVQHPRYTPCYLDKHHPRYPVKRSSIHVQITVSRKFVIRQSFFTLRLRISHAKASERSGAEWRSGASNSSRDSQQRQLQPAASFVTPMEIHHGQCHVELLK